MLPTMFTVTLVYAVCWLPQNLLLIIVGLHPEINDYTNIQRIWWACHVLAMLHCVVNPVIYFIRNKAFRQGFAFVFHFCIPMVQYDGSLNKDRVPVDYSSKATYGIMTSQKAKSSQRMSELSNKWTKSPIMSPKNFSPTDKNISSRRLRIILPTKDKFTYKSVEIEL
uniref:G-protein coupled receptors family 1 profile domain-containing protein n=1 Tax=Romanomermis culicivorax TaxID=13658 RepID=A0A915I811_ROMCU